MDLIQRQVDKILYEADFLDEDEEDDSEDCTCDDIPDEEYLKEGNFPLCDVCQRSEACLDREIDGGLALN